MRPKHTMILAAMLVGAFACERAEPRADAELLMVTGDSTFWVTSVGGAVRVRGVPMLVARVDGRFTELYVADDDRSFYNAVFVGHRLFARDLIRGDSVELHRDTLVARLAGEYARAHPDEERLAPDEPENDNASIRATSDIEILGVHGPFLSYEHHTDVDTRDEASPEHRHAYRRGVLDVRTGEMQTLGQLFGRASADSAIGEGQREWRTSRDTLAKALRSPGGASDARAGRALAAFAFDAASFTIGSDATAPTVRFAVPARGVDPDVEPVELHPRPMSPPAWWAGVVAELPASSGGEDRWVSGNDTLTMRPRRASAGWEITLTVSGVAATPPVQTSSAVERVVWLDRTVTNADRAALTRAFTEAGDYDGGRQIARAASGLPVLAARFPSLHLPSHDRNAADPHRSRVTPRVVRADDAAGREHPRPRIWRGHPRDARQDGRGLRDATLANAVRHRVG